MPKLDTSHPACRDYFLDVAAHWVIQVGVDGWRLDVANEVDHAFWRAFRERVGTVRPDALLLGEVWHEASAWLHAGDQFDSVMNYPWRDATLAFLRGEDDARAYDQTLTRLRFAHPAPITASLLNLLGSHDTPRVRTALGGSIEKAAQAAVLLLTAPGVPMIYYGDEIGMEGAGDPDCRRCYPWDDPAAQDAGLLSLYRRLIALRRALPWLNDGGWQTLVADPLTNVFSFRRTPTPDEVPNRLEDEDDLLVVLNASGRANAVVLPGVNALVVVAGVAEPENDTLILPPHGFALLAPPAVATFLNERENS
jgi:glycosidase